MKVSIGEYSTEVSVLNNGDDIDFGGLLKIKVEKEGREWRVTNAMDGYGNNCFEDIKNLKLVVEI